MSPSTFRLALLSGAAALLCTVAPAQVTPPTQTQPVPAKPRRISDARTSSPELSPAAIQALSSAGNALPVWTYHAKDANKAYTGTIVGRNPKGHGHRTTTIKTFIVPVVLHFPDNTELDPRASPSNCGPSDLGSALVQSPIFDTSHNYTFGATNVGTTQFGDALLRANFWTSLSGQGTLQHTLLAAPIFTPAYSADVPSGKGNTYSAATMFFYDYKIHCGRLGVMDDKWWAPYAEKVVAFAAAYGAQPSDLVIVLTANTIINDGGALPNIFVGVSDVLGFHSSANGISYAWTNFNTTNYQDQDIASISHEIAEWMFDPYPQNNHTQPWGNIGQVTGCQADLEVGDPLSGTLMPTITTAGKDWHTQEMAFFSWFFHETPSQGVNGWYSSNGTFTAPAKACP